MTSLVVRDLLDWADAEPDAEAVVTPQQSLATRELVGRASAVVASLRRSRLRAGDLVAVSADGLDEVAGLIAVSAFGAIPVITPSQSEFEVSRAVGLVHRGRNWAPKGAVVIDDTFADGSTLLGKVTDHPTSVGILTSGTTGVSKLLELDDDIIETRLAGYFDWWPTDSFATLFRVSAISGLFTMVAAFRARTPFIFLPVVDAAAVTFLAQRGIRHLYGSPHQVGVLLEVARRAGVSLQFDTVSTAGAPQPAPFIAAVRGVCSGAIRSIYGSTEAGGVAIATEPVEGAFRGLIGRGAEFQIIDSDGVECAHGVEGRVRYRAPGLARRYRIAGEVVPVAPDGWFYPGDWGVVTEPGHVVILRREGDIINVGGVKLNPLDIEALAESVEGVLDAGCSPVTFPDGKAHLVLAVVVRTPAAYDKVVEAISARPVEGRPNIVVSVPNIPRNRNGKIERQTLADLLGKAIRVTPKGGNG